jgi:hypothetical protein
LSQKTRDVIAAGRRLAGLYPADDLQALYCDEVLDAQEDLSDHIGPTIGLKREELRQARWLRSGTLDHVPTDPVVA